MSASHELLPHTSEVLVRIRASSLGELLVEAARALAAIEAGDGGSGPATEWVEVVVTARDREALLVHWLNELLFHLEHDRLLPEEIRVERVSDVEVCARVRGRRLERPPSLVKAATFHGLRISDVDGGLDAQVILDV